MSWGSYFFLWGLKLAPYIILAAVVVGVILIVRRWV